ncbi:MAG TPA: DUF4388 domain-containing protein [Anaerolineaceae bacterium]|nr:DUF4388 domain-containing protein [Anaerolineaceae bacterium]
MGIQGSLQEMTVVDLIQHACQDQKTAQLTLSHASQQAVLYFKDGNVIHAVSDGQEGDEAVFRALFWEDGTFSQESGVEPPATTITRTWASLLLEGAKRLDEKKQEPSATFNTETTQMAQKLEEILQELSGEVNGYIASVVVGMDGIHVAYHSRSKIDPDLISAQMTLLFKLVDTSVTKLGAGALDENLVTTENAYFMVKHLPGKEYYVGVAADRKSANIGNLRLMARMFVDRISKAMPRA